MQQIEKDLFLGRLDDEVRQFLTGSEAPLRVGAAGVFLCERGTADVRVDYTDYHLEASSLFVYFPYSTLSVLHYSDDIDGLVMSVDLDEMKSTIWSPVDVDAMMNVSVHPVRRLTASQYDLLLEYVRLTKYHQSQMESISEEADPRRYKLNAMQCECLKHALILQILLIFADNKPMASMSDRRQELVRRFLISLSQHFREQHEVSFYAAEQHMSMRYFSHVVRTMTEKTPTQWISNTLLTEARRLLLESDETVAEIARELHFPSQSYFGKWLKQRVGVGPLRFRREGRLQS